MVSWGEFSPPLEDVAMLTSLLLFGEAHAISLYPNGEDKKRIGFLTKSLSKSKYSTNKTTYLSWAKYFDEGEEGSNSRY